MRSRILTLLVTLLIALPTFAYIDCEDFEDRVNLRLDRNSANLYINTEEDSESFYYAGLMTRRFGNELIYSTFGFELKVDLWPDRRPQWAKSYSAVVRSDDLFGGDAYDEITCRYY